MNNTQRSAQPVTSNAQLSMWRSRMRALTVCAVRSVLCCHFWMHSLRAKCSFFALPWKRGHHPECKGVDTLWLSLANSEGFWTKPTLQKIGTVPPAYHKASELVPGSLHSRLNSMWFFTRDHSINHCLLGERRFATLYRQSSNTSLIWTLVC